jgi:hypothetical protein
MGGSGGQDPGIAGGKNDDVRRQCLMPSVGKRRPRRSLDHTLLALGNWALGFPILLTSLVDFLLCLLSPFKSSGLSVPMCWCRPQLAHKESRLEQLAGAVDLWADSRSSLACGSGEHS